MIAQEAGRQQKSVGNEEKPKVGRVSITTDSIGQGVEHPILLSMHTQNPCSTFFLVSHGNELVEYLPLLV